jgi:SAM-dependent methyltransferase
MSLQDAERWNARYLQDERYSTFTQPRPFLIDNQRYLPSTGLALDIATGMGGNAGYLLERGVHVVGIDISCVAVQRAKERFPALMAVVSDLNHIHLPPERFDVILNFYYLQRDLWPQYLRALRPGGLLIFETLTVEMLRLQPEIDPAFLLESGELCRAFANWQILVYREGWEKSRRGYPHPVASLVARRP